MKTFKKILKAIAIIFAVVFINGCYYVFHGQFKSQKKLDEGKELNLYECCSIYTMHMAVWMFGWPISPESSRQAFLMTFPSKDRYEENGKLFDSALISAYSSSQKSNLYFDISRLTLREMRYALAVNGGIYYNTPYNKEIVVDCLYGHRTDKFDFGLFEVSINYRLLSYIQNKNIIHKFKMTYTDPLFIPA